MVHTHTVHVTLNVCAEKNVCTLCTTSCMHAVDHPPLRILGRAQHCGRVYVERQVQSQLPPVIPNLPLKHCPCEVFKPQSQVPLVMLGDTFTDFLLGIVSLDDGNNKFTTGISIPYLLQRQPRHLDTFLHLQSNTGVGGPIESLSLGWKRCSQHPSCTGIVMSYAHCARKT